MDDKVTGKISDGKTKATTKKISSGSIVCDACSQDGDKKKAVGFCVECQHYLCEECFKYHCLPLPMRHHQLLEKSEMPRKKVDESLSEICASHEGEMIKYYCKRHEIVGCNTCMILHHKQCTNICTLGDIAKDVEQSTSYQTFFKRTKQAMTDVEEQLKYCKENVASTKSFRETAFSDINKLQEKVNKLFESLKQNIAKKAEEKERNDIRKIRKIEDSIKDTKDALQNLKEDCEILKETKQNKQLFVALNKIKKKLDKHEQNLKDLKKENNIEKYFFAPNKSFTDILRNIDGLGKLQAETVSNHSTNYEVWKPSN